MPRNNSIKKILILGSGPVVIGQGSEYEPAGYQACTALREEGYEVAIVNSSPATITTNSEAADRVYIEPMTVDSLTRIIELEKPDAILPAVGGQAALNLITHLGKSGILKKRNIKVLGIDEDAIARAEDRKLFREMAKKVGVKAPQGGAAASIEDGMHIIREMGFPAVLKPAYTAGGAGSGTAYNMEEFVRMLIVALKASPISQVLIEKSASRLKELEFEVIRDAAGSSAAVAAIEDIDPAGLHPGDSAAVFPPQTIPADVLNKLVDLAEKMADTLGVVGSVSIRFGYNCASGDIVALAAIPGACRNSTLAGRLTGIPIARIAAKLAVGYTLDELENETGGKKALQFGQDPGFCAVKLPRFAFDKFPGADPTLGTSMKSVGEAVAIGGNFKEALQKTIRSLETGRFGLGADGRGAEIQDADSIREMIARATSERLFYIRRAIEIGLNTGEIADISGIDIWFIDNIKDLVDFEKKLEGRSLVGVPSEVLAESKRLGYSDVQLATLLETDEEQVRIRRKVLEVKPAFRAISNSSHFYYATYEPGTSVHAIHNGKKVIIPGGGPDRIGQGIQFDYVRAQAALAASEESYESIAIVCNPNSVIADIADVVYISPLTREDVLDIIEHEKPIEVMPYLGGETPINLSKWLVKAGVDIAGTCPKNVDRAKDWAQFDALIKQLQLKETDYAIAGSTEEATDAARRIGYPLLVGRNRPIGGRAVEIVYDQAALMDFLSVEKVTPEQPALMEGFLEDAIEVGIDAISDGQSTLVCGVMEHIEQAGIHAGDSACSLPPYSLREDIVQEIRRQAHSIAKALDIRGFLNVQFAVKGDSIYVLNINPYASRFVPFVSKATGVEWAKIAVKAILGRSFKEQGIDHEVTPSHISVKEAVFPFTRFEGVDVVLGPEMKSTGEVMGIDKNFGNAYIKAQVAAGQNLPQGGTAFVSIADADKPAAVEIGMKLQDLGFKIIATKGTAKVLREAGVEAGIVSKIGEGRPDATDLIKNNEIDLIINTPSGKRPRRHEVNIRSAVVARGIPIVTTIAGAKATLFGMETARSSGASVRSLQEYQGK